MLAYDNPGHGSITETEILKWWGESLFNVE